MDSRFINSVVMDSKGLFERFRDQDTKVIFGGRKNFIKRCKGQITREEFNKKRLVPLCSIGQKTTGTSVVKGNSKFKLTDDLSQVIFKTHLGKIKLDLCGVNNTNIRYKLSRIYKHQTLGDTPITYKLDLDYIYISFDEGVILKCEKTHKQIKNRVLGIDLNPNYVGWSIVDWKSENEFVVIKSGVYSMKYINDKEISLKKGKLSSEHPKRIHLVNKRKREMFEVVKNLINKSIYYQVDIVVLEDLSITPKDSGYGKRFNRLVNNQWCRESLVSNLQKRCNIFGIKLLTVKPQYSSFIGNFLFRSLNLPNMVLASIEVGRRGYEFYNQYIIKSKEIKKNIIQPDLDKFKSLKTKSLEEFGLKDEFKDLVELYCFFKKSKLLYRLSVDDYLPQFSSLVSHKSRVKYLDFGKVWMKG